jgi:hypothetical protein
MKFLLKEKLQHNERLGETVKHVLKEHNEKKRNTIWDLV